MKLKSILVILALVCVPVAIATPARADGTLAVIKGQEQGSRVNLHTEPLILSPAPQYGLVGDQVIVLRSVVGPDGYTWDLVHFPQSGAEGWIRSDFVQLTN